MKNVSKLLAAVVLCGLAALPSFTAPGAAATDAAAEARDAAVEVVEPGTDPTPAGGQFGEVDGMKIIEMFTDRCPASVVIKAPFPIPDNSSTPSLPEGRDILLARSKDNMCRLIDGSSLTEVTGVCQHDHNKKSDWTKAYTYTSIMDKTGETSRRIFRWFCNKTRERSRCKEGTTHVRFRLMPGDAFQTMCLKK